MEKTELKIKVIGEPVLRKRARAVDKVTDEHRQTLKQMARMMYDSAGIGLAAPQVGISQAMIVVDAGKGLYKLINPKIGKRRGKQFIEEGCLSLPGINIRVKRAKKISLTALDEEGNPVAIEAEDLLACVFQHEIDHLHGKLIIDYASLIEKMKYAGKIRALKKRKSAN